MPKQYKLHNFTTHTYPFLNPSWLDQNSTEVDDSSGPQWTLHRAVTADILLLVMVCWPIELNAGNIGQCRVISALPGEAVSILRRSPLGTNQKWCTLPSVRDGLEASSGEGCCFTF